MELQSQPTAEELAAAANLREALSQMLGDTGYVVMLEDLDSALARTVALAIGSVDASCISGSVPLEQDPNRAKTFLIFPRAKSKRNKLL